MIPRVQGRGSDEDDLELPADLRRLLRRVEQRPGDPAVRLLAAELMLRHNRAAMAVVQCRSVLEQEPANPRALRALDDAHRLLGRIEQTESVTSGAADASTETDTSPPQGVGGTDPSKAPLPVRAYGSRGRTRRGSRRPRKANVSSYGARLEKRRKGAATGLDIWLTLRMLAMCVLLSALYVGLAALTVYALFHHAWGRSLNDDVGVAFMPVGLALLVFVHFSAGDRLVLRASLARVTEREFEPGLYAVVDRLALLADIPPPRVALSAMDAPNSLAFGLWPRARTVVVTETLRRQLTPSELEAVLAHEISHLANKDALVLTAASFYRTLAGFFGDPHLMNPDYQVPRGDDWRAKYARIFGAPFRWALLVVGTPLTLSLSRYREYVADRGAALLTGSPESVMSALIKLGPANARIPMRDLRRLGATHPFLLLPLRQQRWWLLMDHPPLCEADRSTRTAVTPDARLGRLGRFLAGLIRPA